MTQKQLQYQQLLQRPGADTRMHRGFLWGTMRAKFHAAGIALGRQRGRLGLGSEPVHELQERRLARGFARGVARVRGLDARVRPAVAGRVRRPDGDGQLADGREVADRQAPRRQARGRRHGLEPARVQWRRS